MKNVKMCVLAAAIIWGSFSSIAVFAQESRNPNDELEVLRYERQAEQYLSADITAKELEQKYDGKVDIETIPLSEDKLDSVVSVLMDGKESDDIKSSVSLEKIHLENAESSMYVLSAEAKKSTGSKEKDGVTLTGVINWLDKPGTQNILTSVSATRLGSYTGTGTYSYGGNNQILKSGTFSGSGFTDQDNWGAVNLIFHLNVSTPTAKGNTLSLQVRTSALD